ncbi:M56 family metallopeptidase [Actinoplanes sp. CA-030573]|uniref:M56 family metallopeptidase n=1 Tax=Actinoplanes sp. CA-030573 TaxID=3239898 RepID=UPI003D8A15AC
MTALLLGALGLTLSLVVPGVLAAARWPDRAPAAAVLLWQAITLTAVLSALGVVLAGPEELARAAGAGRPVTAAALVGALAVAATIVLRLLWSLYGVTRRSRERRARHRLLVDLLDRAEQRQELDDDNVRVLQGNLPLAYCVPGREARVVLSDGALRLLGRSEVEAVLAHEQTHLRHRHEVVMESFTAFYRAVPAPLRSRAPLNAVHLLLEMVADDAARRRTGSAPLRGALERLTGAVPLSEDVAPGTDARDRRLARLAAPPRSSIALTATVALGALALLVLPTVILVLPWLDRALEAWPL